jgi:SMI1 / KNR4 family (SUKH-1)
MIAATFRPIRPAHRLTPDRTLVAELEKTLGASLPAPFIEFLLANGGTGPRVDGAHVSAPIPERCSWGSFYVGVFFGFYDDGSYDIRSKLETYKGRMPVGMLPFATDPGGNIGVISTRGTDAGTIYFWDHEHRELHEQAGRNIKDVYAALDAAGIPTTNLDIDRALIRWEELARPYPNKPPGYGNLYRIAGSFETFLDGLQIVPDEDA